MVRFRAPLYLLLCLPTSALGAGGPDLAWYGRLALSAEHRDSGLEDDRDFHTDGSRIGLRGNYPLSQRWQALFQLEGSANHRGGGSLTHRESFAGITGPPGMVRLGQFNSPLRELRDRVDLFDDQVGSARNLTRNRALSDNGTALLQGVDERLPRSIHYQSPSLGGWQTELQYSSDPGGDDPGSHAAISGALLYQTGRLLLGLGREHYRGSRWATRFIASHEFGAWQFSTLLQQAGRPDDQVWGIGVRYQIRQWRFAAQYYELLADNSKLDAVMLALGIRYDITRRFGVYLNHARIENGSRQLLTPYEEDVRVAAGSEDVESRGADTQAFALGLRYDF